MADKKLVIGIGADISELEAKAKQAGQTLLEFTDTSTMNIGEMRREIKKLGNMSLEGISPEQLSHIRDRMAELTDELGDTRNMIQSMSGDTFEQVAGAISSVTTMANGLSAAYGLLGGDEKQVGAMMERTIALMAIAQGMQEVSIFLYERAYGIFLRNKTKEISLWLTEALTINSASAAAGVFNRVIAQNPIMWLVAAVAALAVGIYLLTESMDIAGRKAAQLKTEIEAMTAAAEETKAWGDFAAQLDDVFDVDRKSANAIKRLYEYRDSLEMVRQKLADMIRLQGKDASPEDKKRYEEMGKEIIAVGDQIIIAKANQKKKELDDAVKHDKEIADAAKRAAEKAAAERKALIAKQLDEARADYAAWMAIYDRDVENHMTSEKERAARVLKLRRELVAQLDAIEKGHTKVVKGQIDITTDPLFDPTKPLVGIQSKPFELPVMVKLEPLPIDPIKVEMLDVDVSGAMAGVIEQVSTALGEAAATGDWSNFGSAILTGIAGFMQQVGSMFIAFGTAKMIFETSGNPWAMIAAGAAMVAIGAGIKAATSKSASKAAASGGAGGGGGGQAGGWDVSMAQAGWGDRGNDVRFVIEGSQLVGVLGNESNRKTTY